MIARGYLKDVKAKEVSWLWKPYIAFGKVTLIQGDTGIGKTSLLMKVIADLSNGIYPPTMFRESLQPQEKGKPLTTYYISIENGIDDTIVPLFDLLGGNREYVQYQEERNGHFVLTGDEIRECVKMTGARLIVVDPWQQFLDNASSTDNNAFRNMIREVQNAAEETGAAVVLAGNYTKAIVRSDLTKGLGGAELNNTLRSILTVRDGNDPSERQLTITKMSFLGKEVTPVVFRQDEKYKISYVYDDYSMESEDAPVEDQDRSGGRRLSKGERTAEFIREILADGPLDSNEVKRRVNESEFSMTTVNRIKDGIVIIEQQSDKSSLWRLKG
jgi:RecA-family ATPase